MAELDPVAVYLRELRRDLRLHPSLRERVLDEIETHLRESAAAVGAEAAITRLGEPGLVARSFTPRRRDRIWQERDRLTALAVLAALVLSLPPAADMQGVAEAGGSDAWRPALAFLAPTAAVAVVSSLFVLARRPAGVRLSAVLAVMVAITAVVTMFGLPPLGEALAAYEQGVALGHEAQGCEGPALPACASDRTSELRWYMTLSALCLAAAQIIAAAGWMPRHARLRSPSPPRSGA